MLMELFPVLYALFRSAVGLDPNRADDISVMSVPFEATLLPDEPVVEPGLDYVALAQTFSRPLIGLAGLITALILGMRLMTNIKETAPARTPALAGAPGGAAGLPPGAAEAAAAPVEEAVATPAYVSAPQPPTVQIQDPAMTARVLKAWMKES